MFTWAGEVCPEDGSSDGSGAGFSPGVSVCSTTDAGPGEDGPDFRLFFFFGWFTFGLFSSKQKKFIYNSINFLSK